MEGASAESEWSAVAEAYALRADARTRDRVLTEQAASRTLGERLAEFGDALVSDLLDVLAHARTVSDVASGVVAMLTAGDRGIILGVALVIVSLSLLASAGSGAAATRTEAGDAVF